MSHCKICETKLEHVNYFGNLPFSNALAETEEQVMEKHPLNLAYCRSCDLLQLAEKFESSTFFNESYPYQSGTSEVFKKHCADFASEFTKESEDKELVFYDIGGNDGTLAKIILDHTFNDKCFVIDPSTRREEISNNRLIFKRVLFEGKALGASLKADYIIFQNSFAHMPNPKQAIELAKDILKDDGEIIIELPIIDLTTKDGFWETVYHEHQYYWSETSLARFMFSMGFKVEKILTFPSIQGGSARFYFSKMLESASLNFTSIKLEAIHDSITKYVSRQIKFKSWLRGLDDGKPIIGITASAKAANLCYALSQDEIDKIQFIADDTHNKQFKCLPFENRNVPIRPFRDIPNGAHCIIFSKNYEDFLKKKLEIYNPASVFCP